MAVTVQDNWVVSMDYTLCLANGEVVDTSEGREPLEFIQGQGQIIPGLEKALLGMVVGEEKDITGPPAEGYGEAEPGLTESLPRDVFPPDVEEGDSFRMRTESGHTVIVYVDSVTDDTVVVDLNHPLAGETLHFHVKIVDAREATDQDLASCAGCSGCSCGDQECDCEDEGCDCGHHGHSH
jgi:FKBP-type peptidyl-prolyl cis-trans isomerase SlyD